jgi:hypothetical protein
MWKAIASPAIFPSMAKHPKRPRDTNQLAKLMVNIPTGQVEDRELRLSKLRRDVRVSIKLPNLDTVWNQMSVGAEIISS